MTRKNQLCWNLKEILVVLMFLVFTGSLLAQEKGTFTDKRDSKTYKYANIGKQVWMIQNLNYTTQFGSWAYNDDTATVKFFGRLYDWNTAKKVCPSGWHLPTGPDWDVLIKTLGGIDQAGGKFLAMDTVNKSQNNNRATGVYYNFSSLLMGIRHNNGAYDGFGTWGGSWTSDADQSKNAITYLFVKGNNGMAKSSSTVDVGYPVRCIKTIKH